MPILQLTNISWVKLNEVLYRKYTGTNKTLCQIFIRLISLIRPLNYLLFQTRLATYLLINLFVFILVSLRLA